MIRFAHVCRGHTEPGIAAGDLAAREPPRGAACLEALREGVHSADVILNILARRREPPAPIAVMAPDALRLQVTPAADCNRYDSLRNAA